MIFKRINHLTDNVDANVFMSPFVALAAAALLHLSYPGRWFDGGDWLGGKAGQLAVFMAVYLYSSHYFQPDLDHPQNRPGQGHFPLGKSGKKVYTALLGVVGLKNGRGKSRNLLNFFMLPLTAVNRAWFYLWQPYAWALTHRGISHWPVLGTTTRLGYLWLWLEAAKVFSFGGQNTSYWGLVNGAQGALESAFVWSPAAGSLGFFVFAAPVYVCDLLHWAVDYFDSLKQGLPFCPRGIPRGFVARMLKL